jgi:16S rRNA processing protein RimM
MAERYCLVGIVRGARGLKGEVRIESLTDDPDAIGAYGPLFDKAGQKPLRLRVTGRTGKGQVLARIEGVTDRDGAEAMKGRELYIPRSVLPATEADEYYATDLVGLVAERTDGTKIGRVRSVEDYGAGALAEIEGGPFNGLLVPLTGTAVVTVDLAEGRLVIDPPPGLLEGPKGPEKEEE